MSSVSFEQMAQLLSEVFDRIHGNPPGWQDQRGFQGDPGSKAAIAPPTPPDGDPGLTAPAVGKAPPLPGGEGDQFQPRNYAYGHMASVLTPEQAAAFRTLMFVQGHTGDTVGRGHVIPIPTDQKMRAE